MSKFNIGDRIEWIDSDNQAVQATVIAAPPGKLTTDSVVWALWDDDKREAYIEESRVRLVGSASAYFDHEAWTKFILDNAEEIREIPGKHYALIRKAFEAGFNSKG